MTKRQFCLKNNVEFQAFDRYAELGLDQIKALLGEKNGQS